eukprot:6605727-Pyramimonas_sp.AAC.1
MRKDGHRYFTVWMGMSIAARRMATGVSARRFGFINMMTIDKSTMIHWEIVFVAAIQAYRRAWYADRERCLYAHLRELDQFLPAG